MVKSFTVKRPKWMADFYGKFPKMPIKTIKSIKMSANQHTKINIWKFDLCAEQAQFSGKYTFAYAPACTFSVDEKFFPFNCTRSAHCHKTTLLLNKHNLFDCTPHCSIVAFNFWPISHDIYTQMSNFFALANDTFMDDGYFVVEPPYFFSMVPLYVYHFTSRAPMSLSIRIRFNHTYISTPEQHQSFSVYTYIEVYGWNTHM